MNHQLMDQGLPEHPILKRLYILNHNALHVSRAQVSVIPTMEGGEIQLGRSGFSYV